MGLELIAYSAISIGLNLVVGLFAPPLKNKAPEPNLRVPRSNYGSDLGLPIGLVRVGANKHLFSTADQIYTVVQETQSQGKGGGGAETEINKYFGTFGCIFCLGRTVIQSLYINGKEYLPTDAFYQTYFAYFDGQQTTPWSEVQLKSPSPLNQIAYKGLSYGGFTDLPLEEFGNLIPQEVSASLYNADLGLRPTLDVVVQYICNRAGISSGLLDVTELASDTLTEGFLLIENESGYRRAIEELMQFYLFTAFRDSTGKIVFKKLNRGAEAAIVFNDVDYVVNEQGTSFVKQENDPDDFPSKLTVKFNSMLKNFDQDEIVTHYGNSTKKQATEISFSLNTYPDIVRERSLLILRYLTLTQKYTFTFTITSAAIEATPIELFSLVQLSNGEIVQVQQISFNDNYTAEITAKLYVAELDYNSAPLIQTPPTGNRFIDPPIPDLYILDTAAWNNDPPNTLYMFANGKCTIQVAVFFGAFTENIPHQKASTIGDVLTQLPTVSATGVQPTHTVDIQLVSGSVESYAPANQQDFRTSKINLCLIGSKSAGGYWDGEFLQFETVTDLGSGQYRLSDLTRGLYGTFQKSNHSNFANEKFFLFKDAVRVAYYSSVSGAGVGTARSFRVIASAWQDLGTTPVETVTPDGNAYKPSAVTNLTSSQDADDNIKLTWDFSQDYSLYETGTISYEIDIIFSSSVVRTLTSTVSEVIYTIADRTTDGVTFPFTVEVYAVSSIVGRGFPSSLTVAEDLNPPPIVFGTSTGGGLNGIKYIDGSTVVSSPITYTVLESDDRSLLVIRNATAAEFTILDFADTLPNGFQVEVLMDKDTGSNGTNDLNARVSFQCTNFLPDDDNQDLLVGGTCTVIHAGSGNYVTIGNNRRYTFVDDIQQPVAKTTNFVSSDSSLTIVGSTPQNDLLEIDFSVNAVPTIDITDGITTVTGATAIDFTNFVTITDNAGVAEVDISVPSPGIDIFDGATTVTGATSLEVLSGGTVGGTTPNATLTISNGGVSGIEVLTADTTLYVDIQAGSDTTGDGTVGSPYKTPQKALERHASMFHGKYNCTILLTDSGTGGYKIANEATAGNISPIYLKSYASSGGRAILKCDTGVQIKTTTAFTAVRPPDTTNYNLYIGCINIEKSCWRLENINIDATQYVGTNGSKGLIVAYDSLIEAVGTWTIDGASLDTDATCYYFLRLVRSNLKNLFDEVLTLNFDGYFSRLFEIVNNSDLDLRVSKAINIDFGSGTIGETLISSQYINLFANSIARTSGVSYSGNLRDNPNFAGSPNPLRYKLTGQCLVVHSNNHPAGDLTTDQVNNNLVDFF